MNAVMVTVVPVFLLIGLGWFAAKRGLIDAGGVKGLSQFVFVFAIPALLFRIALKVDIGAAHPWKLWAAFYGAGMIVWVLAVLLSGKIASLKPAGGSAAAISSSFGNLVMMGIPLSFAHYGEAAVVPAALLVAVHAPVQWFGATLRAEWSGRDGNSLGSSVWQMLTGLAKNPIVVALVAGALWGATGFGLHPVVDRTISLLGQAGVPAALFALGLSLAGYGLKGHVRGLSVILVLKMLVFPAIAAVFAFWVFELPPLTAKIVVLFACLPPGANAFLFATRYKAAVAPVSGAIAIGTVLALFSVTSLLWVLGT